MILRTFYNAMNPSTANLRFDLKRTPTDVLFVAGFSFSRRSGREDPITTGFHLQLGE
jgi:hypothetical protein